MMLDHRQHHLEYVRAVLSVFVYPVQYVVNLPITAGEWFSEGLTSRQDLLEENSSLQAQNLLLKRELQKLEILESENNRLRELLDSSLKVEERVLVAEILAIDLAPFSQQIVINKGSRDNVHSGQTILDSDGVIGQVVHVNPLNSTAMLITDPSHAVPVENNRNGLRAIAVGTGKPDHLELPNIHRNADIQKGDLFITSGLGGRFPPNYPVGRISKIERSPDQQFVEVTLQPTAHLESSRQVLLLWTEHQQTTEPANETGALGNSTDSKEAKK